MVGFCFCLSVFSSMSPGVGRRGLRLNLAVAHLHSVTNQAPALHSLITAHYLNLASFPNLTVLLCYLSAPAFDLSPLLCSCLPANHSSGFYPQEICPCPPGLTGLPSQSAQSFGFTPTSTYLPSPTTSFSSTEPGPSPDPPLLIHSCLFAIFQINL